MIRLIHAADLHLDSPFSMQDIQRSDVRRQELKASFMSLIRLTERANADLLIISGDLFDSSSVTHDTLAMISSGFATLKDCRIIISPGNHDPFVENGIYSRLKTQKNVYIFEHDEVTHFDFPDIGCRVYGYAFTSPLMEKDPLCGLTECDPSFINILVAHADLDVSSSHYAPITSRDLALAGFDYAALGHVHDFDGIHEDGDIRYAYCGCLESRGFDELGEKGIIAAALSKEDGKLSFNGRFVPLSKRIYLSRTLDVTDATSSAEILEMIKKYVLSEKLDSRHALKLSLEGRVSPGVRVLPRYLQEKITELFLIKIVDKTKPKYDTELLETDPSIRGAFYERLKPLIDSDDEETRAVAELALKYGLAALDGDEVSEMY